jgi:hypothetical protein
LCYNFIKQRLLSSDHDWALLADAVKQPPIL